MNIKRLLPFLIFCVFLAYSISLVHGAWRIETGFRVAFDDSTYLILGNTITFPVDYLTFGSGRIYFGSTMWMSSTVDATLTAYPSANWFNYSVGSSGTQQIYKGSRPRTVYFDDVAQTEDAGNWSYLTGLVTLTPSAAASIAIEWDYQYILLGAYDEDGLRDGAINITFYRPVESPLRFELDGNYTASCGTDSGDRLFRFDLGNNESRVYYVYQSTETIYVFRPAAPFYVYYITVTDLVGVTNGYIESMLNINGTNRVVERWKLDVLNEIPFTLSWGMAYNMRLVCDQGMYVFGSIVAGADTEIELTVTSNDFPVDYTSFGQNISLAATRPNATWIQVLYTDNTGNTTWIDVDVQTRYGASVYSQNSSVSTLQFNWYSADNTTDYIVKCTINHATLGMLYYNRALPSPLVGSSPFDFGFMGNWFIAPTQLVGLLITVIFAGVASSKNVAAGLFVTVLMASIFVVIGWLVIESTLLTVVMCMAFMLAFAAYRRRQ